MYNLACVWPLTDLTSTMPGTQMLLDQIMLETGCFDKPCRLQVLDQICRIAVQPHDSTAEVIEGSSETMSGALAASSNSKTLLVHDFEESEASHIEPTESLRQLCLSHCSLHCLQSLPGVEVLVLWNCSFKTIEKMPNLKALVIVDTFIRPEVLAGLLEDAPSIQRLALIRAGDVLCGGKGAGYCFSPSTNPVLFHTRGLNEIVLQGTLLPRQDLVHNIQANSKLEKLSISQTWLPDQYVAWMAHAMGEPTCNLKDFSIKEVQWSPFASMWLVNGLYRNTGIERLDVSGTLWHPSPRTAFCHFLQHHAASLEELKLESMVDPSMISAVLDACNQNCVLKAVTIARNYLECSAMESLAKLLRHHPSLEEVNLSHCFAGDDTCWADALKGLASNSSVKSLSLEKCRIGKPGAIAIGKALAINTTLRSIDLCHNGIDVDGTRALVEGLEANGTLQRIFLHGNKDEAESTHLLRDLMRDRNTTLRVVFVPESCLQEELQYYGALNFAGRKYVGDTAIPHSLWPTILVRAVAISPEIAFHLLQEKPDLLIQRSATRKRPVEEVPEDAAVVEAQARSRRRKA